mgnify:CR=1 FL=1
MYELMVIAKTDSADEVFGKIEKFLKDIDAVSVKAEKLGKKVLAYPIAKQTEGDYFLYNFEAETQTLKGLADKIRLEQEDILRHMLVKVPKAPKVPKVSKVVTEEKEEDVREKPKVTVTTRAKVSEGAKVSNVSKGSKVSKAKDDNASKKEKKTVESKKKGKS